MNRLEYLTQVVGEEAAEITQAASKINRFGLIGDAPSGVRNIDQLKLEFNDMHAAMVLLKREIESTTGVKVGNLFDSLMFDNKIAKLEKMMEVSQSLGRLDG